MDGSEDPRAVVVIARLEDELARLRARADQLAAAARDVVKRLEDVWIPNGSAEFYDALKRLAALVETPK